MMLVYPHGALFKFQKLRFNLHIHAHYYLFFIRNKLLMMWGGIPWIARSFKEVDENMVGYDRHQPSYTNGKLMGAPKVN